MRAREQVKKTEKQPRRSRQAPCPLSQSPAPILASCADWSIPGLELGPGPLAPGMWQAIVIQGPISALALGFTRTQGPLQDSGLGPIRAQSPARVLGPQILVPPLVTSRGIKGVTTRVRKRVQKPPIFGGFSHTELGYTNGVGAVTATFLGRPM